MKRKTVIKVVAMTILALSSSVFAQETTEAELTPSQAKWSLAKKVVGVTAGWCAGFVGHELGHQFVATIENVDMTWRRNSPIEWWAQTDSKTRLRNIALGGFASEILGSEIVLEWDKIPKDNSFVIGYLLWNITNPILYTIKNETRKRGYADLKTIDQCGFKSEYVEMAIVVHALLSAYRLYKKPEFPLFIKATHQEIVIGLSWQW